MLYRGAKVNKEKKILLSGNEAIAEGAIQAGCRFYAGYPITPQNELTAYMARRMPEAGGVFIQAESEIAAINMVMGAAASGIRAMTSSSSPGISLKQEGISYLAGAELPAVIVNMMRGGPGLGNILPSQSDYFQATKGGGHGDYHCLVLAPSRVQESFDTMFSAFSLADKYRVPAIILGDGMLGQVMEPFSVRVPAAFAAKKAANVSKPWALTGCAGREPNVVKSFYLRDGDLEDFNLRLQKKYAVMLKKEARYEGTMLKDADLVLVAYGTMARICSAVVRRLRKEGKKAGLIRPVTLWPFPVQAFLPKTSPARNFLVAEMSYGQMLEDVKLALDGRAQVNFIGRAGGGFPLEEVIAAEARKL
ncbi:MAG: 3-methyl-2-oxobutanoate dehydrogenase subunit VorB [Candidatus Omnitrophota bacterium]|jgi:2-oxoglutarate ferredoxin oxidoreductase subunit alpha|nr:3-methyl-2-oxobutanoate dehydrogenase subunit VorB [Candidatus Omnitrophota bacterium]MDD5526957.1 3-methyl-2-oxobutanoate dehydrogenase subunit VorB [Candidatus Omnitrophota bacterium]